VTEILCIYEFFTPLLVWYLVKLEFKSGLSTMVNEYGHLHLQVPEDTLVERVVGRRLDPVTGKIYHLKYSPPETEEIAARLTQRFDDTEEKVYSKPSYLVLVLQLQRNCGFFGGCIVYP
jgi:hypothetical protein